VSYAGNDTEFSASDVRKNYSHNDAYNLVNKALGSFCEKNTQLFSSVGTVLVTVTTL
jgi:hypothetical protein